MHLYLATLGDASLFCRNLLDSQDEEAFLAAQLEAERQALALAMAESLDEDKARKAAEQPLEEWEQEELLQRFKASSILREVFVLLLSFRDAPLSAFANRSQATCLCCK